MFKTKLICCLIFSIISASARWTACPASACDLVANFDNLGSASLDGQSYSGFQWRTPDQVGGWLVLSSDEYMQYYHNTYGSVSPDNLVLSGETSIVDRPENFTLVGAQMSTLATFDDYNFYGAREITVEGWDDGQLKYSNIVPLQNDRFEWTDFNYEEIDEVRFVGGENGNFVMDDFTYRLSGSQSVPEPNVVFACLAIFAIWFLMRGMNLKRWKTSR